MTLQRLLDGLKLAPMVLGAALLVGCGGGGAGDEKGADTGDGKAGAEAPSGDMDTAPTPDEGKADGGETDAAAKGEGS